MTAEHAPTEPLLRWPLVTGAGFALLAVMAGAFGAHGLRSMVSDRTLEVFQTAVTYQMYHALALVLVSLLAGRGLSSRLLEWAARFFLAGIVLFCGSLYLLVLVGAHWLGPVTPMGGLCFMVGWALLITAGVRQRAGQKEV
ncbi:hypothetical protein MSNKSG1_12442 [Marinobacter santoriniensis NKSG1]|uniref:DUF423 domain-containing protein n=1 Tax=Marinobacter santoriniensis NKSG1 TaxID=1288826 RepID=M7D2U9_9GAMM|nr:hypothetical protein MSNKSG1_12442 [Marinobacter santoriniensis NKSG1]